eukprot:4720326-Pleurochrysis_carterae.AAC.2
MERSKTGFHASSRKGKNATNVVRSRFTDLVATAEGRGNRNVCRVAYCKRLVNGSRSIRSRDSKPDHDNGA